MTEALQEDGITYDTGEEQASEAPVEQVNDEPIALEEVSDLAPELVETPEPNVEEQAVAKVDGVEVEGPEGFKKAINKQHFRYQEEKRQREALEVRLKELEAKAAPAPVQAQDVPTLPDTWDDDYAQKMAARDAVVAQNAGIAERASVTAEHDAQALQERQRVQAEHTQKLNDEFNANGKRLGCNEQGLIAATNVVVQQGVTPEIANFLLTDPDGPLMIQELAANPIEQERIMSMPAVQAGIHLATVLRGKIARPKPTSAPAPAKVLKGSGPAPKHGGPEGATFT